MLYLKGKFFIMIKYSFFLVISLFALTQVSNAQMRAVTEKGDTVLLYANGTWQFGNDSIDSASNSKSSKNSLVPIIVIDSTKEVKSEMYELLYALSPRLERFFGKSGKIRCKLVFVNSLGVISLRFVWEVPVGDGDRYFGRFDKGKKVIFSLSNGQKVELEMADEAELQRYERNNYTMIANSTQPLTMEQINALVEQPITEVEVGWWKKKSETYELEESRIIQNMLPTVF